MRVLAWSLSFLLLAQTLIPLQSHSRFDTGENGQVVLICTLVGSKTISLDERFGREAPVDDSGPDEIRNPAMLFSQLLAENTWDLAAPVVRPFLLPAVGVDAITPVLPPSAPLRLLRNRDPPNA